MDPPVVPEEAAVRQELERILRSTGFARVKIFWDSENTPRVSAQTQHYGRIQA